MERFLKKLENEEIKRWYKYNVNPKFLNEVFRYGILKGYILDTKSGLFVKKLFSDETIKKLGYTIINLIFPRPVDLHYHKETDEALYTVNGKGVMYYESEDGFEIFPLYPERQIYIPKNIKHSLRPHKNNFLEIIIACSKIFGGDEICVEKFYEFEPWANYYRYHRK